MVWNDLFLAMHYGNMRYNVLDDNTGKLIGGQIVRCGSHNILVGDQCLVEPFHPIPLHERISTDRIVQFDTITSTVRGWGWVQAAVRPDVCCNLMLAIMIF